MRSFERCGKPFCGRISGFGSVGGAVFGSWRTNVLVSVRFGCFRPSRSVSTLSGGDFFGFGSRRPPFDTQCAFSTLLPRDFRLSGGVSDPPRTGFDPPSEGFRHSRCSFRRSPTSSSTLSDPFATLLLRVSALSDPLTGFRPSFPRGIPCLTLPLFQPFISVVLSMTQTPLFTFPVLSVYSLA